MPNGLCENTHGMGDGGSLSLVSLRAEHILAGLQEHDRLQPVGQPHTVQVTQNA